MYEFIIIVLIKIVNSLRWFTNDITILSVYEKILLVFEKSLIWHVLVKIRTKLYKPTNISKYMNNQAQIEYKWSNFWL